MKIGMKVTLREAKKCHMSRFLFFELFIVHESGKITESPIFARPFLAKILKLLKHEKGIMFQERSFFLNPG